MFRAVLTAVALGIVIGQVTLDYVFPEPAPATEGYDPATWKICPGTKSFKVGKNKAWWYCGPDADGVVRGSPILAESAASGRASSRVASSGSKSKDRR